MDIRSVNSTVTSIPPVGTGETPKSSGAAESKAATPPVEILGANPATQESKPQEATETFQSALKDSVNKVNEAIKVFNSSVRFSIDEETQLQVVRVVDVDTEEVIRQFPSEDVLAIARAFDKLQGLLLKDKA